MSCLSALSSSCTFQMRRKNNGSSFQFYKKSTELRIHQPLTTTNVRLMTTTTNSSMMMTILIVATILTINIINCDVGTGFGPLLFTHGFVVIPKTRSSSPCCSQSHNYHYQKICRTKLPKSILHATADNDENYDDTFDKNSNDNDGPHEWKLKNDFEQFLNQCSIQSMIFTMNQLRDRQTALWLEDFTKPIILRKKRTLSEGGAATQKEKDDSLASTAQPEDDAVMKTKTEKRQQEDQQAKAKGKQENIEIELLMYHGLNIINTTLYPTWDIYFDQLLQQPKESYIVQSNNPYVPDYDLEINPPSLCTRIISVREQICNEFTNDLDIIADLGGQTMNTYWTNLIQDAKNNDNDSGEGAGQEQQQQPLSGANMFFLESDDYFNDVQPSPLRKGNFDLLLILTTQEAIHRLLNRQIDDDDPTNSNVEDANDYNNILFLKNFYLSRLSTHFVGNLEFYGRADSFLQELLTMSPSMIQFKSKANSDQDNQGDGPASGSSSVALIDPMRIVELILLEREKIAIEWSDLTLDIIDFKHMDIKRKQLNQLMSSYGNNDNDNNGSGSGGTASNSSAIATTKKNNNNGGGFD